MSDAQDGKKRGKRKASPPADEKPRCGATRKGGELPDCRIVLEPGQLKCKFHGGASPQARRQQAARALDAQLQHVIRGMDIKPVENPLIALSHLAGEIIAWKDLVAAHVGELKDKLRYEGEHAEQIRGEVILYERSLDRAVHVLSQIARLKIDERLAAISEAQVLQMTRILEGSLDAIGLTYDQKRVAFAEMSRLARKQAMSGLPATG